MVSFPSVSFRFHAFRFVSYRFVSFPNPSCQRWHGGQLPAYWDSILIPVGDHVILDVETPTLGLLDVQGRLEFSRNVSTVLNTHAVKVWGELEMGTPQMPMPPNVTAVIQLHGDIDDPTVVMVEDSIVLYCIILYCIMLCYIVCLWYSIVFSCK